MIGADDLRARQRRQEDRTVARHPDSKTLEKATAAARKMLATEFPELRADHSDIGQNALLACLATFKSVEAFPALVVKRARGLG